MKRESLSKIMSLAWQMVRKNGYTISEALKVAWQNFKLKAKMKKGVVRFYYRKVNGELREAFGTLSDKRAPETKETGRKANNTLQTYYDTEREEWRSFKIANLVNVY